MLETPALSDAARLLVTCFADDALMAAQLEGVSNQEAFLGHLFEMQLQVFARTMDVFSLDDGGQTLLVGYETAWSSRLKSLYYSLRYGGTLSRHVPKEDLKVFGANSRRIASQFKQDWFERVAPNGCYHIKIMAIDPSERGRGTFRRLIEPTLDDCRARGLPVVLETNSSAACAIYEHFGFVRKETFQIRPQGFDIVCYLRE